MDEMRALFFRGKYKAKINGGRGRSGSGWLSGDRHMGAGCGGEERGPALESGNRPSAPISPSLRASPAGAACCVSGGWKTKDFSIVIS